jgi:antitoxin ParD1/3/4
MVATNVHLTPELERFARECVEGGRYNNVSEVVRSGLRLLQDSEDRRHQVLTLLQAAEDEADRDGTVSLDALLSEVDGIITDSEK